MAKESHGDPKGAEEPKPKPHPPEKREEDEEAARQDSCRQLSGERSTIVDS